MEWRVKEKQPFKQQVHQPNGTEVGMIKDLTAAMDPAREWLRSEKCI